MRFPILLYHKVGDPPPESTCRGLYVTPEALDRQLALLGRRGFAFCTLDELASALDGGPPLPPRPVFLTFDDGHADNGEAALPVLRRRGARATIFVLAGQLGQGGLVWEDASERAPARLLTWNQARELQRAGWSVQNHGLTHRKLDRLDPGELALELEGSRRLLEAELGVAPVAFSYPYGVTSPAVRAAVAAAGYRLACTTEPGLNELGSLDPLALRRHAVKGYRWTHGLRFRWLARNFG